MIPHDSGVLTHQGEGQQSEQQQENQRGDEAKHRRGGRQPEEASPDKRAKDTDGEQVRLLGVECPRPLVVEVGVKKKGRSIESFETREEALDWLAEQ